MYHPRMRALNPLLALIPLLAVACATSPLGRTQIKLVSDAEMDAMGVASFTQLKGQTPESKDAKVNAYVGCIARNVTAVMPGGIAWEVRVFDDKNINAFALPGGKIGVFTGLMKAAQTPDQLAAVIGHEVAHVIAGHSNERYSEAKLAEMGNAAVSQYTGVNPELLGMATSVFFLLPHSRTHEAEADILGMDYMAKAGFDPRAAITLWENMAKASGDKPPEILSTHPSDQTRIKGLTKRLTVALPLYEQARAAGKKPSC
jgi:predicted Zn-dependent protease